SLRAVEVPPHAPPMFVVLAADDPLFANDDYGLITSWKKAGKPVEFHLYQNGGHGFGLGNPGKTSQGWFPQFMLWLERNGMLRAREERRFQRNRSRTLRPRSFRDNPRQSN